MNRLQHLSSVAEAEESIPERFAQIAARYPDRIAVSTGSTKWTYAELDAVSANCARVLQEECQSAFAPVALLMKHDAPLIAAIIGVLRSGGFYLVLNPAFPLIRLREIVNEIRPRAIIADAEHQKIAGALIGTKTQQFLFDELATGAGSVSVPPISPSAPCALFYTSGSSGRPRPLVYRHGSTWRGVMNHAGILHITPEDRLTLLSPCSAAASVSATFGALLNGACLFPFQPVREGLHKLQTWIGKNGITIYHSVPSLFRRFVQTLAPGEILPSVRAVKLGGEPVFAADFDLFREHFKPGAVLINGLGLTEANGNVCHFRLTHEMRISGLIMPIGKSNEGIEIKLLDDDRGEVVAGEIGEIVVRGKQVSPAYWTGSAVQQHGLDRDGWFRTGDLGCCNSQGFLEYFGRKDGQLKLRGQWINIAEVEAALARIPSVRDAAVVSVDTARQTEKIAAFVSWSQRPLPEQELRRALGQQLPSYSVPNYFFSLRQLPLLPNGKVDRRALSQRARQGLTAKTKARFDPSDLITLELVRLWRNVLESDSIGVADNFFIFGGDSLAATTMLAAVEKRFGISLPVSSLLEAPTVEKLAELIRRGGCLERDSTLVALQSRGTQPPLYCVPGAGSEPLEFRPLAAHLGNDQPLFAFQPQGLDGRSPFQDSVEDMAAYYLASLRRHQSCGPYRLCGHSFGGVVAFEMAQRLIKDGDKVEFLGLLDSYAGEYPKLKKNLSLGKKLMFKIHTLAGYPNAVTIRSLTDGMKMRIRYGLINLYLRLNFRSETTRRFHWRFLYHEACVAARRRHKLRPLPLKIHLFRVQHQPAVEFFEPNPLLGWDGMADDGIDVHELPGNHEMQLREPGVAILAQKLRACLEQCAMGDAAVFGSSSEENARVEQT